MIKTSFYPWTYLANQETTNLVPFKSYGTHCGKNIKNFQVFLFLRLIDSAEGQTKFGIEEFSGVFLK